MRYRYELVRLLVVSDSALETRYAAAPYKTRPRACPVVHSSDRYRSYPGRSGWFELETAGWTSAGKTAELPRCFVLRVLYYRRNRTRPAVRRLHFMTRAPGGDARAHSHFRRDRKARSYAASRMKDHCRDPGRTQDGTRARDRTAAPARAHVTLTVSDSLQTRGFAPPRPRTGSGPEGARRRPRPDRGARAGTRHTHSQ